MRRINRTALPANNYVRCESCNAVMYGIVKGDDKPKRTKCIGCDPNSKLRKEKKPQ